MALLSALLLTSFLTPSLAAQDAQGDLLSFNIPSQNTASALNEFARQADVQLMFPYDAAVSHESGTLKGMYTRDGALTHFLSGTDLVVASETSHAITLRDARADASADDVSTMETVVVSGQRLSQQRSIDVKRNADAIEDVISSDEIGQLPDKNAAENVERLPGVNLTYDQGEGRYVNIRGVDSALNNVTLDGISLGSPDSDSRAMPLDVVSGQLVSRIEVIKAVTPDMDAQAVGGTVNMVMQSPFDFDRDFMARGSAQIGYEELNHKTPWKADASLGGVFGANHEFGWLIGIDYSDRNYRTNGLYPDDWRSVDGSDRGLPTLIKATHYELGRERIGGNLVLEYRPSENDKIALRALYSDYVENERRQRFRLNFATDDMLEDGDLTLNDDGETGSFTGASQQEDYRHERKRKTIATISLSGEHTRGPWHLDYDAAYVRDKLAEPNQAWTFKGGSVDGTYDMSSLTFAVTPDAYASASDLKFNKYTTQNNFGSDEGWTGKADLKRDLDWGDGKSYLKVGMQYRTTTKMQDDNSSTYTKGTTKFSLADFELYGNDTSANVGGETYKITPTIDEDAMVAFTKEYINDSTYFSLDEDSVLSNDKSGDYHIYEKVLAGYAMANISFGELSVLGGLRIEHTDSDADGYMLTNDTTLSEVVANHSYTDLLPTLHILWQPREDTKLHAAYTQTLGRPAYSDLAPATTLDYSSSSDATVSEGNPDLKPYRARNFDLSAEYYPDASTMLSLGGFYKYIDNPIYSYAATLYNTTYAGETFEQIDYSQPRNARHATVLGAEADYRQQFDFLPGLWSGFGLDANVTLSTSRMYMADRSDHLPFPKQASTLYGVQLFYQKYGIEGRLSYHFGGKYLNATGDDRSTDDWFNAYRRFNARISYDVTDTVSVFVTGENLLDEPLWEYQGGHKNWVTGYERYGRTVYVGVSAHL